MFKYVLLAWTLFLTCAPVLAQSTTKPIDAYIHGNLSILDVIGDVHVEGIQPPPRYYSLMPGYNSHQLPVGSRDEDEGDK